VPLGGQGYFLPPTTEGVCVLGSTYRHGVQDPGVTLEGQQVIKDKMAIALTELMSAEQPEAGWSGGRAVVQGRLPVICELDYAQNLWLAVGYGSHGLTWSSFAGDIIGSILEGEPVPLERDLFKAIGLR
jgi:tRNA 5-methylaminomethyl-2-thiouridine biosynthesis bifunctional protein